MAATADFFMNAASLRMPRNTSKQLRLACHGHASLRSYRDLTVFKAQLSSRKHSGTAPDTVGTSASVVFPMFVTAAESHANPQECCGCLRVTSRQCVRLKLDRGTRRKRTNGHIKSIWLRRPPQNRNNNNGLYCPVRAPATKKARNSQSIAGLSRLDCEARHPPTGVAAFLTFVGIQSVSC